MAASILARNSEHMIGNPATHLAIAIQMPLLMLLCDVCCCDLSRRSLLGGRENDQKKKL
jgi:hypothetical protein